MQIASNGVYFGAAQKKGNGFINQAGEKAGKAVESVIDEQVDKAMPKIKEAIKAEIGKQMDAAGDGMKSMAKNQASKFWKNSATSTKLFLGAGTVMTAALAIGMLPFIGPPAFLVVPALGLGVAGAGAKVIENATKPKAGSDKPSDDVS